MQSVSLLDLKKWLTRRKKRTEQSLCPAVCPWRVTTPKIILSYSSVMNLDPQTQSKRSCRQTLWSQNVLCHLHLPYFILYLPYYQVTRPVAQSACELLCPAAGISVTLCTIVDWTELCLTAWSVAWCLRLGLSGTSEKILMKHLNDKTCITAV